MYMYVPEDLAGTARTILCYAAAALFALYPRGIVDESRISDTLRKMCIILESEELVSVLEIVPLPPSLER